MVALKILPDDVLIKSILAGELFQYDNSLYMRLKNTSSEQTFGPKAAKIGTGKIVYLSRDSVAKPIIIEDNMKKEEL